MSISSDPVRLLLLGDKAKAQEIVNSSVKRPLFVLVISYTKTSEIPRITVAGSNPEMVRYTSAADAELLVHGHCKSLKDVPATPDGKPTPALITLAALRKGRIPCLIVDAGAAIKPQAPYIHLGFSKEARNITQETALDRRDVELIFQNSGTLGRELSKLCDCLVIGESIPAGTTTALCTMISMGIDALWKVSSSMPQNPHQLKNKVVQEALKRAGIRPGDLRSDPMEAVSQFGDPMMVAVAGMTAGARVPTILAGGTQMAAVAAISDKVSRMVIGTTSYVAEDDSSDIEGLVKQIGRIPVVAVDLALSHSSKAGLRAYSEGFVKEGVGAGGAWLACLRKNKINSADLRRSIEEVYEEVIERRK